MNVFIYYVLCTGEKHGMLQFWRSESQWAWLVFPWYCWEMLVDSLLVSYLRGAPEVGGLAQFGMRGLVSWELGKECRPLKLHV